MQILKETRVGILVSDKIDLKKKTVVARDKGHYNFISVLDSKKIQQL